MLDPQFTTYLENLKKLPELPPEAAMRKAFSDAGWSAAEVDEALAYLHPAPAASASQVVPPPLADFKPTTARVEPLSREPLRPAWPASNPTTPVSPVSRPDGLVARVPGSPPPSPVVTPFSAQQAPASQSVSAQPKPRSSARTWLIVLVILIILGGTGAGAAYMYVEKLGPFAKAPYDATNIASGIGGNILGLQTFASESKITLLMKPREATTPLLSEALGTSDATGLRDTEIAVKNLSATLTTTGVADYSSSTNRRMSNHTEIEGTVAGSTGKLSLDTVFDGDTLFIKGTIPEFFDSLLKFSAVQDTWVRLNAAELAAITGAPRGRVLQFERSPFLDPGQFSRELRSLIALADKAHALTIISQPVLEVLDGVRTYRYDLGLSREGTISVFAQGLADASGVDLTPEGLRDMQQAPESARLFDYIGKAATFSAWFDAKTGLLAKLSFSAKIAPGGTGDIKDLEFDIAGETTFSRINEPVTITNPDGAISFDDAMTALRGISKEQYAFEKTERQLGELRYALSQYYDAAGKYPGTLEELQKLLGTTDIGFVTAYMSDGITYRFTYEMKLPVFDVNIPSALGLISPGYPPGSIVPNTFLLNFLQGTNTATEKEPSVEAGVAAKKDADKDMLIDALEDYVGTDKKLKDTDRDGVSDAKDIGIFESYFQKPGN